MDTDLVKLVERVLHHGIQLKSRLNQGEAFDLRIEQATLKEMLLSREEAQQNPEYGIDYSSAALAEPGFGTRQVAVSTRGRFLGVRYLLVSWLDEFFLIDSPWLAEWNENKLEQALYGTNDRAWQFWDQARLAEHRPGGIALWTSFLCVMLGFRGDLRDDVASLKKWTEATRARIPPRFGSKWVKPTDREIPPSVTPLRGRDLLRRMVMACGTLMLLLVPVFVYFLMRYMDRTTPNDAILSRDNRTGYGKE